MANAFITPEGRLIDPTLEREKEANLRRYRQAALQNQLMVARETAIANAYGLAAQIRAQLQMSADRLEELRNQGAITQKQLDIQLQHLKNQGEYWMSLAAYRGGMSAAQLNALMDVGAERRSNRLDTSKAKR